MTLRILVAVLAVAFFVATQTAALPSSTALVWNHSFAAFPWFSPLYSSIHACQPAGNVYVHAPPLGSGLGGVYALDWRTGAILWTQPTNQSATIAVLPSCDVVFFASDGSVNMAAADSGAIRWSTRLPGVPNTIVADDDTVGVVSAHVTNATGALLVSLLSSDSGRGIWQQNVSSDVNSRIELVSAMANGTRILLYSLYRYASTAATVAALNAATGDELWTYSAGKSSYADLDNILVSGENLYVSADYDWVRCLSLSSGALLWSSSMYAGDSIFNARALAILTNGPLFVGRRLPTTVFAVNPSTGAQLWRYSEVYRSDEAFSIAGTEASGAVIAQRYIGMYDPSLLALNASTGAVVSTFTTGAHTGRPAFNTLGMMFIVANSSLLAFGSPPTTTCTPTILPTSSQTPSGTASETASATTSTSSTPLPTPSQTMTATPSHWEAATPSLTTTRTTIRSSTPSPLQLPTPTFSSSASSVRPSPTSPSPSPPTCFGLANVHVLHGTSGTVLPLSTAVSGNAGMYTNGYCGAGYATFFPGSRLVYSLSLGDTVPVGGTLTVTTCGATRNNTVLYVGTGCPKWAQPFGCLVGNDDAPACPANALASTVTLTAAQRNYFIQLGGADGRTVVSGLRWSYVVAPSPSGTRSRSLPPSRSPSRLRASGSRTRTRKAKK